jgi:hypothetical protein
MSGRRLEGSVGLSRLSEYSSPRVSSSEPACATPAVAIAARKQPNRINHLIEKPALQAGPRDDPVNQYLTIIVINLHRTPNCVAGTLYSATHADLVRDDTSSKILPTKFLQLNENLWSPT